MPDPPQNDALSDSGWQVIEDSSVDGSASYLWQSSGPMRGSGRAIEWGSAPSWEDAKRRALEAWYRLNP